MDRKLFFDHARQSLFGGTLSLDQVAGMIAILDEWDRRKLPDIRFLAYMLATTFHETARTMQPIREYGLGRGHSYAPYYGRGFVQLTWKANYAKASKLVGADLVANPDRALELPIATDVLFDGMLVGWFTGKKLSDFINAKVCDYIGARKIINGTDKASTIAGYARSFETALRSAASGVALQPDAPPVTLPPADPVAPKPQPPAPPAQKAATAAVGAVVVAAGGTVSTGHPWLWVAAAVAVIIVTVAILTRKGTFGK